MLYYNYNPRLENHTPIKAWLIILYSLNTNSLHRMKIILLEENKRKHIALHNHNMYNFYINYCE